MSVKAVKRDNKNPVGRPLKFNTPEELEKLIEEYYESCWEDKVIETTDKDGVCTMSTVHYQREVYTVAGMAYFLGFVSRQSMYDYEQRNDGFSYVLRRARLKLESQAENALMVNKSAHGPLAWLKNHAGYVEKQEREMYGKNGGPIENRFTLTDEELMRMAMADD